MKWRYVLLVLAVVGVLGYEFMGLMDPAPGDTWSEHFWAATDKSDLPSLVLGVLVGHFTWPRKKKA